MIIYDKYPFNPQMKNELKNIRVRYAFQPIFYNDCRTVFAYEALMRPQDTTITELIYEYTVKKKLHILEVATIFGATQAHVLRGFEEPICINSFPSEAFTEEETRIFDSFYGDRKGKAVIEILEYPFIDSSLWKRKRYVLKNVELKIALDDFGTGVNTDEAISYFEPDIIKLDRTLIRYIDKSHEKQENLKIYLESFHKRGIEVLAEGVETAGECEYLVKEGIDYLQGYYLGMPE